MNAAKEVFRAFPNWGTEPPPLRNQTAEQIETALAGLESTDDASGKEKVRGDLRALDHAGGAPRAPGAAARREPAAAAVDRRRPASHPTVPAPAETARRLLADAPPALSIVFPSFEDELFQVLTRPVDELRQAVSRLETEHSELEVKSFTDDALDDTADTAEREAVKFAIHAMRTLADAKAAPDFSFPSAGDEAAAAPAALAQPASPGKVAFHPAAFSFSQHRRGADDDDASSVTSGCSSRAARHAGSLGGSSLGGLSNATSGSRSAATTVQAVQLRARAGGAVVRGARSRRSRSRGTRPSAPARLISSNQARTTSWCAPLPRPRPARAPTPSPPIPSPPPSSSPLFRASGSSRSSAPPATPSASPAS